MARELTTQQRSQACHAILVRAYAELGGQARNIAAEIKVHGGQAYSGAAGFLARSQRVLDHTKSYKYVKHAFSYKPLPKEVSLLVDGLVDSEKKWASITGILSSVRRPNWFRRVFAAERTIPRGIPLQNGFKTETPDLIPLLNDLLKLYTDGDGLLDELFASDGSSG